jgi:hypothetical protein
MRYGTPDRGGELRQEVADFLDVNRADYEGSLVTDRYTLDGAIDPAYDAPSWDAYIKKVSGNISTIVCSHCLIDIVSHRCARNSCGATIVPCWRWRVC